MPSPSRHQGIAFGNHLHVAVLDAVVDHFHVVAGTVAAHPIATRAAVFYFGSNSLEEVFDVGPSGGVAAGHDARAFECALLAAGDARAHVEQAFGR